MDTICIDIDNKTPGALLRSIIDFILPRCSRFAHGNGDIICLSTFNKYFHNTLTHYRAPACILKKFCGLLVCQEHSADFADLRIIHGRIRQALAAHDQRWIHFDSLTIAHKARPFVEQLFGHNLNTCCGGKGYAIRKL